MFANTATHWRTLHVQKVIVDGEGLWNFKCSLCSKNLCFVDSRETFTSKFTES